MSDKVSDERIAELIQGCEKSFSWRDEYKMAKELKAAREVLDGECVWAKRDGIYTSACHSRGYITKTTYCGECRKKVRVQS